MKNKPARSTVKEPAFVRKKAENEREELHQFIYHFCRRPQMFFRNGSFAEADAAVYGWMRGVSATGSASEWWGFHNWYGQNYPHLGSSSVFSRITEKYPDDPSRFRRLRFLFNKYIREKEKIEAARREETPLVPPS